MIRCLKVFSCILLSIVLSTAVLAQSSRQLACDNWLSTPTLGSRMEIGDLDITGNQLTVEAVFNRTQTLNSSLYYGSLVSKHSTQTNVNYSLLPNGCELTTTTGYRAIFQDCPLELNKTYHVAMVYDGVNMKFYRNGLLLSYVACTGNVVTNDLIAAIGQIADIDHPSINQFLGYINEVRIWNVARSQADIVTYMNTPLPNPTAQAGLRGYYTFGNTINKQGNAAWNGTLVGSAAINTSNTFCGFGTEVCPVVPQPEVVINEYTPVIDLDACKNTLTVKDASHFKAGDTILMIQMKGATVNETNSAAFGGISDYGSAGNYEFNYIKQVTGNRIELKNVLLRSYNFPTGKVQLVRVPYYDNLSTSSKLTCLPWDGEKGGVLALNVANILSLGADMEVSAKGFKGGQGKNPLNNAFLCNVQGYYYADGDQQAAPKGESIASVTADKLNGRGPLASAGGGGHGHNSGGGGGANGGAGGFGGFQLDACNGEDNRGMGGLALTYSNVANKIFLGGGGGAGQSDNVQGSNRSGGNGGGIIIATFGTLNANGFKMISNGDPGEPCSSPPFGDCHDAGGGGGAGGTVVLKGNTYTDALICNINGGKGEDINRFDVDASHIGPGGGGGGGVLWVSAAAVPVSINLSATGGPSGVIVPDNNNPYGAVAGQVGKSLISVVLPITSTIFKANIDSVRIKNTLINCNKIDFKGLAYINSSPIVSWQWYFGDGGTSDLQNIVYPYSTSGAHTVKLVVTDGNGCKDSISVNVQTLSVSPDFNYTLDICNPMTVQFNGNEATASAAYWNFGDGNTLSDVINTSHTYTATGSYTVRYSITDGPCTDTIAKIVTIDLAKADIILTKDTTICAGSTKQLRTVTSQRFCWFPTTFLDNPASANPVTSTPQNITYYFTAEIPSTNLITNGSFAQGNVGFTSQYTYSASNTTDKQYFVGLSSSTWNNTLGNCADHSPGGNMLMADASTQDSTILWQQGVTVAPNTNYSFSIWVQSLSPINLAQFQLSINGKNEGAIMNGPPVTCTWKQFFVNWNSGASTTADISLVNKNKQQLNNQFAIDDISFAPVLIRKDSVIISVEKPSVKASNDTLVCTKSPVQLTAGGALSYTWSPATGLTDAQSAAPVAQPLVSTQYIVTGLTAAGCSAKDTVNVNVFALPTIFLSADTGICKNSAAQLFVSGGVTYNWSPAATLSDPNIPNPVASPSANTMYHVIITDQYNCQFPDSMTVQIRPDAVFSINDPAQVCLKKSYLLQASGGDQYAWSPAIDLNDPAIANPVATPSITTDYTVTITESVCQQSATLSARITVLPLPEITATRSTDLDCSNDQSRLNATGAVSYSWTPSVSLTNPETSNPIARPLVTTTYIVTGTDADGCINHDSVTVKVENTNKGGYEMPNAFTPNNDGLNDCYGIKYWGLIYELEFSVFNRWGELVFYTSDPGRCWDGTFKGVPQDGGVFVYMVKAKTFCESTVFRKGTFVLIR